MKKSLFWRIMDWLFHRDTDYYCILDEEKRKAFIYWQNTQ